jgi:hypothetical protein
MAYARVRKDITSDEVTNPIDYWLYVEARDLEGQAIHYRPQTEWVKATCFDGMGTGLYVLTEDEDTYFTVHSLYLEFADEIPTKEPKITDEPTVSGNLTRDLLVDWTNYDWEERAPGFAWVEHGSEIGVRVVEQFNGQVWIVNEEGKGWMLTFEELKRYGAIAIDFAQFAEYVESREHFIVLADALLAMGADYGLCGSDMGLGVSLPYGAWLDYEGDTFRLWNSEGFEYFATTPEGCARAWQKLEAVRPQIEWANAKRQGK